MWWLWDEDQAYLQPQAVVLLLAGAGHLLAAACILSWHSLLFSGAVWLCSCACCRGGFTCCCSATMMSPLVSQHIHTPACLLAAGYDAAEGDPLGACHVTTECYAWMTEQLQAVAPLVVLLEGGYNLSITAASTEACMRVLLGQRAPRLPEHRRTPSLAGMAVIQHVVRVQVRPVLSGSMCASLRLHIASTCLPRWSLRAASEGLSTLYPLCLIDANMLGSAARPAVSSIGHLAH